MNCPACGEQLSKRGLFCGLCSSQARCGRCKALLERGAVACVECGTRTGEILINSPASQNLFATQGSNQNTIVFREDRNSRSLEAKLSDVALQSIGDSFSSLFLKRGVTQLPVNERLFKHSSEIIDARSLPASTFSDIVEESQKMPSASAGEHDAASTPASQLHIEKIFQIKGDTLELIDNRVKATNLSDYVRRLTYLFLYAQEVHNRPSIKESDVVQFLKASKAWDKSGNSRRWLTKRVLITDEGDDAIKLTRPGREEAIKILNQALDASVEDKWNPDFNKPRPRSLGKKDKS